MPDTTADDVIDAAAAAAAAGVASATSDGQSATAIDPLKQLQVADKLAAQAAVSGTGSRGGPRSAWNRTRAAKAVPPGAAS